MLPFLKPKRIAGVIVSQRKPDGSNEMENHEDKETNEMEICAEDMLRAITSKDSQALAKALQAAFEIMESKPHEESGDTE